MPPTNNPAATVIASGTVGVRPSGQPDDAEYIRRTDDRQRSLRRELSRAAHRLVRNPAARTWLRREAELSLSGPLFGVGRIQTSGRTFQPADDGLPAVILPAVEDGSLVDLVACVANEPARAYTRNDDAAALGWRAIARARHDSRFDRLTAPPLILHPHPLDWLRHGCSGAVLLNLDRASITLAGVASVCVESEAQADALWTAFHRPRDIPRILIRDGGAVRHAA